MSTSVFGWMSFGNIAFGEVGAPTDPIEIETGDITDYNFTLGGGRNQSVQVSGSGTVELRLGGE